MTVGHESRRDVVDDRLNYPANHIEVDNRLSWFLGSLERQYGADAFYVHLVRDPNEVVESLLARWENLRSRSRPMFLARHPRYTLTRMVHPFRHPGENPSTSIVRAMARGILTLPVPPSAAERREVCELYVQTVTDNITSFLDGRTNWSRVSVESFPMDVSDLWDRLGLEGDRQAALAELGLPPQPVRVEQLTAHGP